MKPQGCFCNNQIESTNIDPCNISILINWDKSVEKQLDQNFWCHFDCFKEKLHSTVKQHLVVDLLLDD